MGQAALHTQQPRSTPGGAAGIHTHTTTCAARPTGKVPGKNKDQQNAATPHCTSFLSDTVQKPSFKTLNNSKGMLIERGREMVIGQGICALYTRCA